MLFIFKINLYAYIDGIKIEIVEAPKYGTVHIPLVDKHININTDMFRLGYMQAGSSTKKLIKDNEFYVVTLQDKYSKGKINAIVKGKYMKRRPYNVGILTQSAFLLSKKFLGANYDKTALENRLNEIAKKVIEDKGFILDNKHEIDYTDILLYTNGSKVLYKPYKEYVIPLENKIKNNNFTYEEAYSFVYDKREKKNLKKTEKEKVKKVVPLYRLVRFLHIPKNTKVGTEIETLEQLRKGSAKVDYFEIIEPSIPFRIKNDGTLVVSLNLTKQQYSFEAIARTKDGDSNKISFTIIIDELRDSKFYK
ncbi:MAG: hypothetical protein U9N33_09230 [Campylobacterota bacterium]|nr:hypothetical protein [Campylobacterota bacterium]